MAMIETSPLPADRQERPGRRRPFTTWVKKLASFKNNSTSDGGRHGHFKRDAGPKGSKKRSSKNNNPYPQSGRITIAHPAHHSHPSFSTAQSAVISEPSLVQNQSSTRTSTEEDVPPTAGGASVAQTISTEPEATRSIHAPSQIASSVAGTSRTANGYLDSRKGGDSTFSSPAPSVRSLTTTLTTIQSLGPNAAVNVPHHTGHHSTNQGNSQTIQFTQPFPTNSPASAIPPYLAPHLGPGHPTTYNTATANNLLTDNASILTLASSTKRRRRRSMDTDASVRALAPSSVWGGSRESLPLSVLSANIDSGLHQSTSRLGGNERASIYSTTGVTPSLPGERTSLYAGKQSLAGDGASIRSGLFGHGRADSISGSVVGVGSPLVSPREVAEKSAVAEEKDEGGAQTERE
ncbi:hypothetical protein GGS23DRAFT_604440 [Durotheca rogersii]|uniref:uncharacterized protein n=1 Tax=Durotheca rogersii TaxID=419775 RepID=UPI002220A4AF|nr:uncharacterized protein GGS23DRAFT_604440 [Durotheca rogersii]KAI5864068.1 hypothetical protein GGS23DRAFT_604440 [Durotheca rogersii]